MTAADLLRKQAQQMPHAIVRDRVLTPDGRIEAEREFHYLTCRRCDLERLAQFIEGRNHCTPKAEAVPQ